MVSLMLTFGLKMLSLTILVQHTSGSTLGHSLFSVELQSYLVNFSQFQAVLAISNQLVDVRVTQNEGIDWQLEATETLDKVQELSGHRNP